MLRAAREVPEVPEGGRDQRLASPARAAALELTFSAHGWGVVTRASQPRLSGRAAEALPLLEQGIEQAASKKQWRFYALQAVYLSQAYRLAGRLDDAIPLASQALDSARDYRARGQEAWALWNLGELGLHCDPPDAERTAVSYRQALALADELGMRPLAAHCHHGLGTRYRLTEQTERAHEHLDAATTLYCEMDMRYWIERTGDVCR